jgi:general stress protein CsbA
MISELLEILGLVSNLPDKDERKTSTEKSREFLSYIIIIVCVLLIFNNLQDTDWQNLLLIIIVSVCSTFGFIKIGQSIEPIAEKIFPLSKLTFFTFFAVVLLAASVVKNYFLT